MPYFNKVGQLCWVLGRRWFDQTRTIAQECNTLQPGCVVALSDDIVVWKTGSTNVQAGGSGVWALVPYPAGGYVDSFGRTFPHAQDDPCIPHAVGEDGAIVIRPFSNAYAMVLEPPDANGASKMWRLTYADVFDLHFVNSYVAIWRERGPDPHTLHSMGMDPPPESPAGDYGWTRLVRKPDGRYGLLYQSFTGGGCLVFDGRIVSDGPATYQPDACFVGNVLHVAYGLDQSEAAGPHLTFTPDEFAALERIEDRLAPKPPVVPAIDREIWIGWYTDGEKNTPGNCDLMVDYYGKAPVPNYVLRRSDWMPLYRNVAAEASGTIEALEQAIKDAPQDVPIIPYWTPSMHAGRPPNGADVVGVECYPRADETLEQAKVRFSAAIGKCARAAIIAQCYTSNARNTPDLVPLPALYAQLARDHANVEALLIFSAGSRATGWNDHPEVHGLWASVKAGAYDPTSLPGPRPRPQPITPLPPKPEPPATPFRTHSKGLHMEIDGKIVTLRGTGGMLIAPDAKNTGTWASLNKGWRGVRYVPDGDAQAQLRAKKLASGRYTFTSVAYDGLLGADASAYSPALDKQGYFKPDGDKDAGDYEQWRVYDGNENGAIEAQVEQVTDANHPSGAGRKFFAFPLSVELVQ